MGLKGENLVDDTCWVIKTHSPWCMPFAPPFKANKMICIVRNPLDVIVSWLDLMSTGSHAQKASFEYEELYPEWWNWWVFDCARVYADWHKTVMNDAALRKLPVLWVRFEDLVMDPEPELTNIMRFMLNTSDIKDTNAERRVKEVIAKGKEATVTYTLKSSTRKFNY